nr:MAG TPA: hypothetical protein [Caudoviricetes sp.]DAX13424.1 MAG TPA: hypothetical protein [Bacteriophage sp.]
MFLQRTFVLKYNFNFLLTYVIILVSVVNIGR